MKKRCLLLLPVLLAASFTSYGQLWTTSVPFNTAKNGKAQRAYIWIPPSASGGIRGLILASQTSSEYPFCRDSLIRAAADAEKLAIVHFYPSTMSGMKAADTSLVLQALDMLATSTGFTEIRECPWITFGHSTGSLFALHIAYWKPERTIAVIIHKGGLVPRPSWANGSIHHIPVTAIQGQFEEFGGVYPTDSIGDSSFIKVVRDALSLRLSSPDKHLVAPIISGGEGHMGYGNRVRPLLALFIRKTVGLRLDKAGFALKRPVANQGWLASSDLREKKGAVEIDTFPNMTLPETRLFLPDREFAIQWLEFHKELTKKRQIVCPSALKPETSPEVTLTYVPNGKLFEGRFHLGKTYTVSARSSSELPVSLVMQAGPGIINGNTFEFHPCRTFDENTTRILLRQDGNSSYSVGDRMLKARLLTHQGIEQILTIKKEYPVAKVGEIIALEGTSSESLTVVFDVVSGPGVLKGNALTVKPFVSRRDTCSIVLRAGQGGHRGVAAAPVVEFSIKVKAAAGPQISPTVPKETGPRHAKKPKKG